MKMSKAVGIDLGTTNSVIAMVGLDNEEIVCRTDRSGRKTFPSVVVYDRRSGTLQAGAPAFAKRGTPQDPIVSIKSHMGDSAFRAKTGPQELSPIEVSATILAEMKKQMQEYLQATPGLQDFVVDRAVITIPAYFASNAREATTQAAELAGLKVEYTLQEPTAAVLYYCHKHGIEDGIFLVYDLGGGTFDVTVVKVEGGDVAVLGIAGNNYLGGDNFDEALAYFLLDDLKNDVESGYDLGDFDPNHDSEDRRRLTKLKLVAESIKKALSLKHDHYEEFANIFVDKSGALVNLAMEIKREDFEELIRPILDSTIEECHKALAKAKEDYAVTLAMIDAVLLVGGSTHVPLVSEVITANFTSPSLPEGARTKQPTPLRYEPDMAVGYGAAIAAAGTGQSAIDERAFAIMTGDAAALEDMSEDELVLNPTFGPGSGYAGESLVEGTLSALHGTLPDHLTVAVTRAGGGFEREFPVADDGSFVLGGLLAELDPDPYGYQFRSPDGPVGEPGTFDAAIRNVRGVGVALSRSYYIETVTDGGGKELVELMRQGQELPISRDYEFSTTNSYFAELRFFEESDFLKQVTITFPTPVPPGTAVQLSLSCDRQSRFSARAQVAGVVVDTQFEPSPPPPVPEQSDVDQVLRQARTKVEQIAQPGKRIVAQKQLERLATEVDAAVDEEDSGKARDKLNEIRKLASSAAAVQPAALKPSVEQFEALVARCEQASADSEQAGPQEAEEIRTLADAGRSAYADNDQARVRRAVEELEKIHTQLTSSAPAGSGGGEDRPPLWMLCQVFGPQVLDTIADAEARTDLPEQFRRDHMSTIGDDRAKIRQAIDATKPPLPMQSMPPDWKSDEEAAPHFSVITGMYQKWNQIKELTGGIRSG